MIDSERIVFLDKVFVRMPFFKASAYKVDKLRDILGMNVFRNAIWLSSPEFYAELEKKGFDLALLNRKERLTAMKFFNRMSFRATPFGAFAGFGLAPWNFGSGEDGRYTEMRLHLIPSAERKLEEFGGVRLDKETVLAVNPTLFGLVSGWRYLRYETETNGKLSFFGYLMHYNEADAMLLEKLSGGPCMVNELISYLEDLTDCTAEEGMKHLEKLIEDQVLVSEQGLSLLVDHWTEEVFSISFNEKVSLKDRFFSGRAPSGFSTDGRGIYAGLEIQLPTGAADRWQREIREAIEILDQLSVIPGKDALDKFRAAFEQKFGGRRVPLLEALDPDLGIAYDGLQQIDEHELLNGLEFQQESRRSDKLTWTIVHRLLLRTWLQNSSLGPYEAVSLTAHDLSVLTASAEQMPPTMSVVYSIAGDKLVCHNAGGVTANALTGRFSTFSEEFYRFCKMTAQREADANPDIVFAEILQVSHRKIDNINLRRMIYECVIPLSVFPAKGSLLPADIDVFVKAGELVLLHRPTEKRIIPRLPTAFNFHHNEMPLYRFLCDLQFQSVKANLDFDPEKFFPGLNFYPRIEYLKTVLSLARWHLRREDIDMLVQRPLSISRLHLFCRERQIPIRIAAGRGDQQLVFDLSKDDEALFFLESLHDTSNSVITEVLGDSGDPLSGMQFIASVFNPECVYQPVTAPAFSGPAVRDFRPGSEWIYMKIYTTPKMADYILLDSLTPWIKHNGQRIGKWFFVRYHDPDSHLRVRFYVGMSDVKDIQYGLQSLISNEQEGGLVQRAYFDTYQREIERYTPDLIVLVEDVFHKGSETVIRYLLNTRQKTAGDEFLWPVIHCYKLLVIFCREDHQEIIEFCRGAAGAFLVEHGGQKKLKRSMDDRFRKLKPRLSALLRHAGEEDIWATDFDHSVEQLAVAATDLQTGERWKLVADMIHMQVNRIFSSGQRRHEAFIWHCLLRLAVTAVRNGTLSGIPELSAPADQ